jgi:hypothetical protein
VGKNFLVIDCDGSFVCYANTKECGLELAKKDAIEMGSPDDFVNYRILTKKEYDEQFGEDNRREDREDIYY